MGRDEMSCLPMLWLQTQKAVLSVEPPVYCGIEWDCLQECPSKDLLWKIHSKRSYHVGQLQQLYVFENQDTGFFLQRHNFILKLLHTYRKSCNYSP